MGDYRFAGMEDYRRQEMMPLAAINNYGQERSGRGLTDRQRVDKVRADFLANSGKGNREHSDIRRDALSRALLSPEQVRGKQALVCGLSAESRRQLIFTFLLLGSSFTGTICHSLERSFIGHLGKDSMAAQSITMSIMHYFYGISYMWQAISTKIGRAVGARDNAAIAKYFKMALYLAGMSGLLTWAIMYPFGPLLMRTIYSYPEDLKPKVYELAWPYMCKRPDPTQELVRCDV